MTRVHVKRLSNPRRVKAKRRNAKRKTRRNLSPKQIRIFGTKAQKAALKRRMKAKRRPNPVKRRRVVARRRKRVSNPELILTMGAVNPRRKPMAKARKRRKSVKNARRVHVRRRRRSNPVVHHRRRRRVNARRRRSNPRRRTNRRRNTRVVVVAPRRHNRRRSRRNPSVFGSSITSKEGLKMIGGGLAGVAAAKFLPTLLPASLVGSIGGSNIGRTVLTGAAAFVSGWVAGKWDSKFGDAVLFGGLMQTASVALNAFLPSLYQSLGIGLGDFVPGQFAVPQNPMRSLPPAAAGYLPAASGSRVQATRLASAYNPAY